MRVMIDDKIIDCDRVTIVSLLDEWVLNLLKTPMIESELLKKLNSPYPIEFKFTQATLSRHLNTMLIHGIINYRKPDRRSKEWYLVKKRKLKK